MVHKLLRPRGGFTIMDPIQFLFRHKKKQQRATIIVIVYRRKKNKKGKNCARDRAGYHPVYTSK